MVAKIDIADLLLKQGVVTEEVLSKAKEETRRTGLSLEKALEKLGFIREEDIANIRATALGIPFLDLTDYLIDSELIKFIPENLAKKYRVVPVLKSENPLPWRWPIPRILWCLTSCAS
jgi:type IV pilus assembly protein PilB